MRLRDLAPLYLRTLGRSRREVTRLFGRHILPSLGHISIELLAVADAYKLHQSLARTPYQANRVLAALSAALRHAERLGLRPAGSNPCSLVKPFHEKRRRRYMTPAEAARIAPLLEKYEAQRPREVLFIRLLMLTGARPDEIKRAKWTDILPGTSVIRLSVHKTDGTGDERRIHLPPQAMTLLANAPREAATLVGACSPASFWRAIRAEAGCPDLRLYDLRHTFASLALKAGHSLGVIGELLGHRSVATTSRYAHLMDDAGNKAAASVGAAVASMML